MAVAEQPALLLIAANGSAARTDEAMKDFALRDSGDDASSAVLDESALDVVWQE